MILTKKYAQHLLRTGDAYRQYRPLACITEARKLDKLYAVLARPQADGVTRYDHYVA